MSPTDIVRSSMPLCATLGVTASEFAADRVVLHLDWRADLCTGGEVLHGGVLMALADSAGAACAFLNLPEGAAGTTTIESKTNFLGAARQGASIAASSTPLHRGRTTIVIETELRNVDGALIAKTTQTQAVLRRSTS
jgi:1,4-dihydroxy-2-naphthoyl-CoA hydrolase